MPRALAQGAEFIQVKQMPELSKLDGKGWIVTCEPPSGLSNRGLTTPILRDRCTALQFRPTGQHHKNIP